MSIILLVVGIERIAIGLSPVSSRKTRIIDIVLGVVVIGISIFLMQFPILTSVSLVILGAVALMIGGIARIVQGISRDPEIFKRIDYWRRSAKCGYINRYYSQSDHAWLGSISYNVGSYTSNSRNRDDILRVKRY